MTQKHPAEVSFAPLSRRNSLVTRILFALTAIVTVSAAILVGSAAADRLAAIKQEDLKSLLRQRSRDTAGDHLQSREEITETIERLRDRRNRIEEALPSTLRRYRGRRPALRSPNQSLTGNAPIQAFDAAHSNPDQVSRTSPAATTGEVAP